MASARGLAADLGAAERTFELASRKVIILRDRRVRVDQAAGELQDAAETRLNSLKDHSEQAQKEIVRDQLKSWHDFVQHREVREFLAASNEKSNLSTRFFLLCVGHRPNIPVALEVLNNLCENFLTRMKLPHARNVYNNREEIVKTFKVFSGPSPPLEPLPQVAYNIQLLTFVEATQCAYIAEGIEKWAKLYLLHERREAHKKLNNSRVRVLDLPLEPEIFLTLKGPHDEFIKIVAKDYGELLGFTKAEASSSSNSLSHSDLIDSRFVAAARWM